MSTMVVSRNRHGRLQRRDRRAERRRLRRVDRLSARLAEQHEISAVLDRAAELVERGWLQGAWFAVATARGERRLGAYDVHLAETGTVIGGCLVGAVVHAAGGPATVRSQPVQRTLDLLWHTLRDEPGRRVRWCPGPDVRTMHVLDLTHWNDARGRTRGEVLGLLVAAQRTCEAERHHCRSEIAELALPTAATDVGVTATEAPRRRARS
jgi:hypothetical protein